MKKAKPKKEKRKKNTKEWTRVSREYKEKTGDRYHTNKTLKEVKKILKNEQKIKKKK